MDFLESMDSTQKCVFGVVLAVLVIVAGVFLYSRYSRGDAPVERERHVHGPGCGHDMRNDPRQAPQQEQQGGRGVFVLFYAPWCGYCKTFGPVWDEFTQNFDGGKGIRIIKINADEAGDLAQMHGVKGYPTVKYCPNGIESPEGEVFNGRSMQELVDYFSSL